MAASSNDTGDYGTTIGADAVFKGDLEFDSGARFLGRFEGSITSKGKVLVAEGAECKATIAAKEVAVEGLVQGNVEAGDRIEVHPTGKVLGDIQAARMTMSEGATVNGYCRIGVTDGAPSGGVRPSGGTTQAEAEAEDESGEDDKASATAEAKPTAAARKAKAGAR